MEKIYNVHWEGPFRWADRDDKNKIMGCHVLYAIYGKHPTYGRDVLLYIGVTNRNVGTRISEHEEWIQYEYGEVSIRVASVGEIHTWKGWDEYERYDNNLLPPYIIEKIESLLIFAHQPAYNERSKGNIDFFDEHFRIFNTGELGDLIPEVSSIYHDVNW